MQDLSELMTAAIKAVGEHVFVIVAVSLSIVMAALQSIKNKGKLDWVEMLICGCLTLAVSSALEYLKLPQQLAVFLGGLIGFKGTMWVDAFINKRVD